MTLYLSHNLEDKIIYNLKSVKFLQVTFKEKIMKLKKQFLPE